MAIQARSTLKSWFETGDMPTQEQYSDLIDSLLHANEDAALLNLRLHSSTRLYKSTECALYNGLIYMATVDNQGAFDAAKWLKVGIPTSYDGYPDYDPAATYNNTDNKKATYQYRLFICVVASSQGVAPLNVNGTVNANWQEVSPNTGGFGKIWEAGLYNQYEVVRYNDLLYELQEPDGFESTNMGLEIAAGNWKQLTFKVQTLLLEDWDGVNDSAPSMDAVFQALLQYVASDGSVPMTGNLSVPEIWALVSLGASISISGGTVTISGAGNVEINNAVDVTISNGGNYSQSANGSAAIYGMQGVSISGAFVQIGSELRLAIANNTILMMDNAGKVIGVVAGSAFNKNFGYQPGSVPDIGSDLSALQAVETDTNKKLITVSKTDVNGTPASEKLKLQNGGVGYEWTNGLYTGGNAIIGTKAGEVFYGQDATTLVYYRYEAIIDNVWYRTVRS